MRKIFLAIVGIRIYLVINVNLIALRKDLVVISLLVQGSALKIVLLVQLLFLQFLIVDIVNLLCVQNLKSKRKLINANKNVKKEDNVVIKIHVQVFAIKNVPLVKNC